MVGRPLPELTENTLRPLGLSGLSFGRGRSLGSRVERDGGNGPSQRGEDRLVGLQENCDLLQRGCFAVSAQQACPDRLRRRREVEEDSVAVGDDLGERPGLVPGDP